MRKQQNNLGVITKNSLLIAWSLLSVSLFIVFPGRHNFMQWVALGYPLSFIEKLTNISFLAYTADLIYSLTGIIIYAICSISLGIFITNTAQFTRNNLEDFYFNIALVATQFLIGHAVFSLVFLTYATLFQLTPTSVVITLSLGLLTGATKIRKTITTEGRPDKLNGVAKHVLMLSILILLITVLQSSSRISYDSTAIYFSDAKLTAANQKAAYFTDDTFVASVLQSVIQYAAIIQIFGEQSARMFSWVCGLVIGIFSLALGRKMGLSKDAMAILLALAASSTAFLDLMGDGKVDLISGAFAISTVYWMSDGVDIKGINNKTLLLLIGFLAGFACVTRPFNIFLMGFLISFFYFQNIILKNGINFSNIKLFVRVLAWVGIGGIGLGIYHVGLNWIVLGDPIAFISSVSKINPSKGPWDFDPSTIFLTRLFYPFVVTFKNNPQSLGNISPLFMAFLPAVLMKKVRNELVFSSELKHLVLAAIATLALWIFSFFTIVEIRYVFFLWLIIYIPMAEIIAAILKDENQLIKNTAVGLLLITQSFMILRSITISFGAYSSIDNTYIPQCNDTPFCEYLKPINELANQGDRILTLGAYRYYLRPDLFTCSTRHDEYTLLQELSYNNMDAFWREVYRQGYKYIAYEKDYTIRHLQFGAIPGPENTPSWMELKPLYDTASSELVSYQIRVENPPIEMDVICEQDSSETWVIKDK